MSDPFDLSAYTDDPSSAPLDDEVLPDWADDDGAETRRWELSKDSRFRLDQFLKNQIGHMSRHQLKKVIDLDGVTVNGKKPKASKRLKAGDVVEVHLPPRPAKYIKPQDIPIEVVYEDDDMIVVNKPAGLTVHPAKAQLDGTLVNSLAFRFLRNQQGESLTEAQAQAVALSRFESKQAEKPGAVERKKEVGQSTADSSTGELAHLGEDTDFSVDGLSSVGVDDARPGIVHRLDKFTTGIMIVAKRDETHWLLSRQFERRTNLKCYLALVHGQPPEAEIVIDEPLTRHHTIREAQSVRRDSAARDALTICRVRERYQGYSLVELELKTGRTHQIRVHMQYIGYPLVGDIVYGGEPMGEREFANPPEAAGSRPNYSFAREKAGGRDLYERAMQRDDMILARPALHATLLRIEHPVKGEAMTFTAPVHEPLKSLVHRLREQPAPPEAGMVAKKGTHVDLEIALG